MNLLIMQTSPASRQLFPLRSKYFPQHRVLKHTRVALRNKLFIFMGKSC